MNATSLAGNLEFAVEPGTYYIQAKDCSGKVVYESMRANIWGDYNLNIAGTNQPPGGVEVGEDWAGLTCLAVLPAPLGFEACLAWHPATAAKILAKACYYLDATWTTCFDLLFGRTTIDPDGYVYNADLGLGAKIQGATVTCDVYDEDYQAWSRWPSEFYENQVNPQVTEPDGYYAFFVPPGLYRVTAAAPGYAPHTSPDIRVISQIIHYNIPLDFQGGILFLPLLQR
jgi:hypothetical protein